MDLKELRQAPHLSASSVGDYIDCGLLYKFGRVDKIKPEFKPDALEFGSIIHLVMAEFHQERMVGKALSIKEIHQIFETHWTKIAQGRKDIKYSEGKSFETLLLEGKELLTTYYHKRPNDNFQVLAVEEPFIFRIEGLPVPIIGAMDLVEEDSSGTIVISDNKTSGRAYSNDEVDKNFQMVLYQIAAKAIGYADREILLRFECLIKTKTPNFKQFYTTRSEIDEKRAIKKIIEVWKGIEKGVFIPNDSSSNWKCKNCSFKKNCNDWFLDKAA